MQWFDYLEISVCLLIVVEAIFYFCLCKITYKKYQKERLSFLNTFSYEIHNFTTDEYLKIFRIFVIVFNISSILLPIGFFAKNNLFGSYYLLMCLIQFLIIGSGVLRLTLFFTKTVNFPLYSTLFYTRFFVSFATSLSIFMVFIKLFSDPTFIKFTDYQTILYITSIVSSLILLIYCIIIFIPSFYRYPKLKLDEKGDYVRPKIMIMPTVEWLSTILDIICIIEFTIILVCK